MKYIVLDVETTGLRPLSSRVIEIGCILFDEDNKEIDKYQQLINPECFIPGEASKVNNIRDEDVEGCPVFADVSPALEEFISRGDAILAHNAMFDCGMIAAEYKRLGKIHIPLPWYCTMGMASFALYRNARSRVSLKRACEAFGVTSELDAHRSMGDCERTRDLFLAIDGPGLLRHQNPIYSHEQVKFLR